MEPENKKGEKNMNASAVKVGSSYAVKGSLKRTPASEENRKRVEFMDSHRFSLSIDAETGEMQCIVTEKREI